MDLFAITCTTCKSRLRVRDPAAVGQILSCPKCGGMVMVKPPPVWNEANEQKSDLPTAADVVGPRERFDRTAGNDSAFNVLEELLSDAPPKIQSPPPPASTTPSPASRSAVIAPPATAKPRFVGGPPVKRSSTPPPGPGLPSSTPLSEGPIPPPVKNAPVPATSSAASGKTSTTPAAGGKSTSTPHEANHNQPPAATQPVAAAPRKPWLLMAGSVAVGVLLA